MQQILIKMWPIEKVRPYARNLRKNDHAVDRMVAAITEFGFKVPLLVRSGGELIDGHLRLKAAHKRGFRYLPVIVCDDWTPAQVKAFRLLVNRSASWADWDLESVRFELAELKIAEFDLKLTGFSGFELDSLLAGTGPDGLVDCVPEVPEQPVTRAGDLWLCGPHRVLCGDATSSADVARVLGPATPQLMITDPPYGVEYDPCWREQAGLGAQRQTGTVQNDDRADWTAAYQLFPGDVAYVWHAGVHAGEVAAGLTIAGFAIRSQIIWAKQHFVMSRGHYHWQHEPCWYAVRQDRSAHWRGDRIQSTLWQLANLNPFGGISEEPITGHGAQKPVELMRRPMVNHTEPGGTVYDPFLGSGTTLAAAEMSGRGCLGIDIDPRYVDVAVLRWQALAGKKAVLDGDGKTFDDVRELRDATSQGDE
jgi:DNA modification methylase